MALDAFVGLPSVAWDQQQGRREHYGLAGLYRKKTYGDDIGGVEYRTLSNFWLKLIAENPKVADGVVGYMAATAMSVARSVQERPLEFSKLFTKLPLKDIQTAINKEDKKEALSLCYYLRHSKEVAPAGIDPSFLGLGGGL
jgi:hypothetical protein